MENQSKYDPNRKTVGAMYLDAAKNNTEQYVTCGDLTNELMSSLVEDLNDTVSENHFGGRSFYITVHENKDLQMPRMIKRRLLVSLYRPYPEDDTIVFYVDKSLNKVHFCWCLPHSTEMHNMLANEHLFDPQMISHIKAWRKNDLTPFGFVTDADGHPMPNPTHEDAILKNRIIPITASNFPPNPSQSSILV